MSQKLKNFLVEGKAKNGKDSKKSKKMLGKLHELDDKIEDFIDEIEQSLVGMEGDNPVFVKKAHQLLANMSKEYSEFMMALRSVVNAVDRKGQMLPAFDQGFESQVRDVRDGVGNGGGPPPAEEEAPPPEEEAPPEEGDDDEFELKVAKKKGKKKLKEALEINEQTHITVEVKLDGMKYETVKRVPISALSGGKGVLRGGAMASGMALSQRNSDIIDYLKSMGYKKVEIVKVH